MNSENLEITEENLNNLKEKTRDSFTLLLINNLIKDIKSDKRNNFYELLDYERIKQLIDREEKRNKIKKDKKSFKGIIIYVFEVKFQNVKLRRIEIKNNRLLSDLSSEIQRAFDHEPMHLYEFNLNGFKFGPECDEWREIFDYLDNIRIDSAFNSVDFKIGDIGDFTYDFGDRLRHKIKLIEIREIKNENN